MNMVIASADIDDEEFLRAFHDCELPAACFRHGDHLRLAWLQLHRVPAGEALERVRTGIRRFAAHHGVPHIFHETMTTAWVRLLATHREPDFAQFIRENEHRLNRDLLYRFWTPDALNSEAAKRGWLAPDREALPNAPSSVCLY
jgi:hypothetical protein